MSIYIDEHTRVIVQGITGTHGLFHTRQMQAYGTGIVAGVTPGKGGRDRRRRAVFNTVAQGGGGNGRKRLHHLCAGPFRRRRNFGGRGRGHSNHRMHHRGIPVQDMVQVKEYLRRQDVRLFGPNCPGIISPGKCKLGIMPGFIHRPDTWALYLAREH